MPDRRGHERDDVHARPHAVRRDPRDAPARDRDLESAAFWLDAAAGRPELRDGIVRMFVAAARPAPEAMIVLVRGWAAGDAARRGIRDAIVLGLSRPWWLWLARWLAVRASGMVAGR
ncbi:hypothetical protein AB0L25_01130 [Spirillospora sp. NPDC052242]